MQNENLNDVLENCKRLNLKLIEFVAPIYNSSFQPVGNKSYRLVDDKGNIKTYGTIETIRAYLSMNNRF